MKINKKIIISIITIMMFLLNTYTFAANLNLNVDFDGKKIQMSSETPEMKWNISNLVKDRDYETSLSINGIGNEEASVELKLEIENNEEIAPYLNIKIENIKTSEIFYEGKYAEFKQLQLKVPAKETSLYKIKIRLFEDCPEGINNKKTTIKMQFTAKGNNKANINQNEITTNIIKPVKTKQPYIIFVVLIVLIITLVILFVLFCKTRKVN